MKTLTASDFKARCLAIVDEVAETGEPVTITKRGKAVAQLVPPVPRDEDHPQFSLRNSGRIVGDVLAPVLAPEAWEANLGHLEPEPGGRRS